LFATGSILPETSARGDGPCFKKKVRYFALHELISSFS
jgi:hypothetical protein